MGFGLFHASPRDPIWEYVLSIDEAEAGLDAQSERICLIGHSHVSLFFTRPPSTGRRTYATGRSRPTATCSTSPRASGCSTRQRRAATRRRPPRRLAGDRHRRVDGALPPGPYDTVAAGAAILEAGLPTALAERLQIGR